MAIYHFLQLRPLHSPKRRAAQVQNCRLECPSWGVPMTPTSHLLRLCFKKLGAVCQSRWWGGNVIKCPTSLLVSRINLILLFSVIKEEKNSHIRYLIFLLLIPTQMSCNNFYLQLFFWECKLGREITGFFLLLIKWVGL